MLLYESTGYKMIELVGLDVNEHISRFSKRYLPLETTTYQER